MGLEVVQTEKLKSIFRFAVVRFWKLSNQQKLDFNNQTVLIQTKMSLFTFRRFFEFQSEIFHFIFSTGKKSTFFTQSFSMAFHRFHRFYILYLPSDKLFFSKFLIRDLGWKDIIQNQK